MTQWNPDNNRIINVEGNMVERDALMIAEKIRDYDPELSLLCLDPNNASITDAPFMVVRQLTNGEYERVLEAWQLDDRILERIWASDCSKNNIVETMAQMEFRKKAERDYISQQKRDLNIEMGVSAIKNPTSKFTFKDDSRGGELVTIHENRPATRTTDTKVFY